MTEIQIARINNEAHNMLGINISTFRDVPIPGIWPLSELTYMFEAA